MEFTLSHTDAGVIYHLRGNLIGEKDGIWLTESFDEQVRNGVRQFTMDLAELTHINSSGLGVLITLHTKAQRNLGRVVLANPSSFVRNLLKITKLDTIFEILG